MNPPTPPRRYATVCAQRQKPSYAVAIKIVQTERENKIARHLLLKLASTKLHVNMCRSFPVVKCAQTDRHGDFDRPSKGGVDSIQYA